VGDFGDSLLFLPVLVLVAFSSIFFSFFFSFFFWFRDEEAPSDRELGRGGGGWDRRRRRRRISPFPHGRSSRGGCGGVCSQPDSLGPVSFFVDGASTCASPPGIIVHDYECDPAGCPPAAR